MPREIHRDREVRGVNGAAGRPTDLPTDFRGRYIRALSKRGRNTDPFPGNARLRRYPYYNYIILCYIALYYITSAEGTQATAPYSGAYLPRGRVHIDSLSRWGSR